MAKRNFGKHLAVGLIARRISVGGGSKALIEPNALVRLHDACTCAALACILEIFLSLVR